MNLPNLNEEHVENQLEHARIRTLGINTFPYITFGLKAPFTSLTLYMSHFEHGIKE